MANRAQIPTNNSALIAMIADEVIVILLCFDAVGLSLSLLYRFVEDLGFEFCVNCDDFG